MKRAHQAPVLDPAAVPEVRTEMGAPGFPDMSLATKAAPAHELMAKGEDGRGIGFVKFLEPT